MLPLLAPREQVKKKTAARFERPVYRVCVLGLFYESRIRFDRALVKGMGMCMPNRIHIDIRAEWRGCRGAAAAAA
jgi:hypothetical protein